MQYDGSVAARTGEGRRARRVALWAVAAGLAFWASLALVLVLLAAIAATRFWLVPNADGLRPRVVEALSAMTGQRVALGRLEARWNGWSPEFRVERLQVLDAAGRVALELPQVDASLSWRSLLALEPRLASLTIHSPQVVVRRTSANEIVVAGMGVDLNAPGGDGGVADWLLRQRQVHILHGEIEWLDEWRGLPPLRLSDISARLVSSGDHHRAGLKATPRIALGNAAVEGGAMTLVTAAPIDLRIDFLGRSARSIDDWDGTAYVKIPEADLPLWSRYLPLPFAFVRGRGALQAWFDFEDGAPVGLTADVHSVGTEIAPPGSTSAGATGEGNTAPPLVAAEIAGRIRWHERRIAGEQVEQRWAVRDLRVTPRPAADVLPMTGDLTLTGRRMEGGARQWTGTHALLDVLELERLSPLVAALPIPPRWRERLTALAVRGVLRDVRFSAALDGEAVDVEVLSAQLDRVGWNGFDVVPGVSGLQGELDLRREGGRLTVAVSSADNDTGRIAAQRQRLLGGRGSARIPPLPAPGEVLVLSMPKVWAEPKAFRQLSGTVRWRNKQSEDPSASGAQRQLAEVLFEDVRFGTADASGRMSGSWRPDALGPGIADFSGSLGSMRAADVHRYLPLVVEPDARRWVEGALLDGMVHDTRFRLKGALWHFPFRDGRHGEFEVVTRGEDLTVDYADHWPKAEKAHAAVRFYGPGFVVKASRAELNGTPVGPVEVKVDDMGSETATVDVSGSVAADVASFLSFVGRSPVDGLLDGFLSGARGGGSMRMMLDLALPLYQHGPFRLRGELAFEGARVELGGEVPPLSDVRGRLTFGQGTLRDIGGLRALVLGGPATIEASAEAGQLRVRARGTSSVTEVAARYRYPLLDRVDGHAEWTLALSAPISAQTREGGGIRTELTARLRPERWPLDDVLGRPRERTAGGGPAPVEARLTRFVRRDGGDRLDLALGDTFALSTERSRPDGAGTRRIERALVELGAARGGSLPSRGVLLRGDAARIDVDAAVALWGAIEADLGSPFKSAGTAAGSDASAITVNVRAREMIALGHVLHDVSLRAQPSGQRWRLGLTARETSGSIAVDTGERGEIDAVVMRLARLTLPERAVDSSALSKAVRRGGARWPRVDVIAETFIAASGADWGRLELKAQPAGREWRVEDLRITSAEGSIAGQGVWRLPENAGEDDRSELRLKLAWRDGGQFLKRLGFAGGLERGAGSLEGQFLWPGSPAEFSHRVAVGEFVLSAGEGRFTQMDPGLGKLLGILSLQSLPRRLSFSFDDLFGRGFAFDTLEAKVTVRDGAASTEGLTITGPAARVEIRGSADIERETQTLRVRVYPSLSVVTAIGIGIATANPAIGAAAFLGQKLARDPIERMLMQEFDITGSWSEPVIRTGPAREAQRPGG